MIIFSSFSQFRYFNSGTGVIASLANTPVMLMELNMVNVKFIPEKIMAITDTAVTPQKRISFFLIVI